jgi:ribosomal-protein-serine acetyltransferase
VELRPLEAGDAEALFAAIEASRKPLQRRLGWAAAVKTAADCGDFIGRGAAAREAKEELVYGVFERGKGELVGVVALQNLRATPGLAGVSGWVRADKVLKGRGTEALRLLVGRAFRSDGLLRLYARIDPLNRAARKVVQKLGFQYEGRLRREKRLNGRWIDQECWGLLKSEWLKEGA